MTLAQFADISVYQSASIDWQAYRAWSAAGDGIARISLRSSYGTGFTDLHYKTYRAAAEAAGIQIIHYHYAYPSLNSPQAEADYQQSVVGDIRPNDVLMLDMEETTAQATAAWALAWLERQEQNYGGRLPIIYASDSYIRSRLQDQRLSKYPLVLANWTYDASARPACPAPWTRYTYWQWSDKFSVPGIPGVVDANVFLGGNTTSTYELAGFPMISQRDSDKNADADCVPASIAACLQWLTGRTYTASEVKDAVYGAGYVGGTAAIKYVDYCASQGVTLASINGTGAALVTAIRGSLAEQHPCLITEPDPYASGWTHVCAAYKCDASSITVMDPWIDAPVTKSDAAWASQLEFNQIWVFTKEVEMLTVSSVSGYFKDLGNSVWQCTNGNTLGHGMLNHYCTTGASPLFGLTLFGLPLTGEIAVPGHTGVVLQVFERAVLCYDPSHVIDSPPGAGDVYSMHLDQVTSPAVAQLLTLLKIPIQPAPAPAPVSMPNVSDAVAQLEAAQAAAGVIGTALGKALGDLKQ